MPLINRVALALMTLTFVVMGGLSLVVGLVGKDPLSIFAVAGLWLVAATLGATTWKGTIDRKTFIRLQEWGVGNSKQLSNTANIVRPPRFRAYAAFATGFVASLAAKASITAACSRGMRIS